MIENEFELRVVMKEDEITGETVSQVGTFEFLDIKYYYKSNYKNAPVTVMALICGDDIIIDMSYEKFKEKYNKRKEEILATMGHRPEE